MWDVWVINVIDEGLIYKINLKLKKIEIIKYEEKEDGIKIINVKGIGIVDNKVIYYEGQEVKEHYDGINVKIKVSEFMQELNNLVKLFLNKEDEDVVIKEIDKYMEEVKKLLA